MTESEINELWMKALRKDDREEQSAELKRRQERLRLWMAAQKAQHSRTH